MEPQEFYEIHGQATPVTEDLPVLVFDGERRRRSAILDFARPNKGEHVLDVGCGDGFLLEGIATSGATVAGVEISAARLEQTARRMKARDTMAELHEADATSLPLPSDSFDLVVCTEVLEHLEHPAQAVAEALRVLRRGGRAVFSVPHREEIPWQRCVHCGQMTPASGHLHSFDSSSLAALLKNVGMEDIMTRGTYPLINQRRHLGYLLRALPSSLWVRADRFAGTRLNKGNWLMACGRKP